MQSEFRPSRLSLQHRLTLAHLAVILLSILTAEAATLVGLGLIGRPAFSPFAWTIHVSLSIGVAGLVGLALGAWASRRVTRRLRRTLEISQAWMRGNLSLRIADSSTDDLGLLARQLNLLPNSSNWKQKSRALDMSPWIIRNGSPFPP